MIDEGYVKYQCIHKTGPAPEHSAWQELNDLRSDLVKAGLVGVLDNGVGYGNVSLRTEGEGLFVVSATSTGHIAELGPSITALSRTATSTPIPSIPAVPCRPAPNP